MTVLSAVQTKPSSQLRTRVMVVDDSVVVRGLITRWLTEDNFDVVATASNGRIALEALDRFEPDIVLLDLEMPEMDGVDALPLLLKRRPEMKVVVVSTLTRRNAQISLKCLSLGAADYLAKPEGQKQATTSEDFRRDLIEKLRVLADNGRTPLAVVPLPVDSGHLAKRSSTTRPRCLLIGASTGGPRAVEQVLVGLGPVIKRIPVLIVQHMPAMFTGVFAEHLSAQTGIYACEPVDGAPLKAGTVFIAPGGRHMGLSIDRGHPIIRLDDGAPVNFCRPAVDVLFRDAASVFGDSALAVILTGMGSDGTQGARDLVRSGSIVLAQDEATSIVWGMPGSVAKAGLAQDVLPLDTIGRVLKNYITGARS
ncbi:protein-glutamate methylesterase/protein-glutamine glutaminase [Microvirga sp. 2TAF3]|uniref:protein-glutamate methylesterase/protein-glutamine glutaminase n=1 Tax=Microvirga sp. 2TAF3 TaxID=3233014 RepID=UPI003F9948B2